MQSSSGSFYSLHLTDQTVQSAVDFRHTRTINFLLPIRASSFDWLLIFPRNSFSAKFLRFFISKSEQIRGDLRITSIDERCSRGTTGAFKRAAKRTDESGDARGARRSGTLTGCPAITE